jgi:foldase protein PrsA
MMKDKVKGLVLGLSLGSLIAGSIAYASASQIDVVFKNLKYMIDGVEKKSTQGQAFIYNNKTYVPLRFVGEALGKEVKWDDKNQTIWIGGIKAAPSGSKPADSSAAATFKGGSVSTEEYVSFLSIMQLYNPGYSDSLSDVKFKDQMMKDLITLKVLAQRGQALTLKSYKADAAEQLITLKEQFAQVFANQTNWEQRLKELSLTDSDLQNYIEQRFVGNVYLSSKVSDGTLRDDYMQGLAAHNYDNATVSHILISLTLADGSKRTAEDALKKANEVEAKLNAGEDFAALAKQYSDDPGSKDNGGQYPSTNVNGWVSEFKQAVLELPINKISAPVLTQFGYHIIRVDARTLSSYDEVKESLRDNHVQKNYQDFTANELLGLILSQNMN